MMCILLQTAKAVGYLSSARGLPKGRSAKDGMFCRGDSCAFFLGEVCVFDWFLCFFLKCFLIGSILIGFRRFLRDNDASIGRVEDHAPAFCRHEYVPSFLGLSVFAGPVRFRVHVREAIVAVTAFRLVGSFSSHLHFFQRFSVCWVQTQGQTWELRVHIRAFNRFFFQLVRLGVPRSYACDCFDFNAGAQGRVKEHRITVGRTLTIFEVPCSVIRRVPIRAIHATISKVASIAALPTLVAVSHVVGMLLSFLFFHLNAPRVRVGNDRQRHVRVCRVWCVNRVNEGGRFVVQRGGVA